ncbi:hypothetical protein HYW36_01560 [Candidatus Saccharibacteria bacterium]|nr:hypothetical protein [Candidatus Saccharibacteria bacterium]
MSAPLAKMLGQAKDEVGETIAGLEQKYGYPSADIRLVNEITNKVRQKKAQLGLDPSDTTSQELYYSLQAKFDGDIVLLNKALGLNANSSFDERLSKAIELLMHTHGHSEVWALKSVAAKSLLRACPPKKTMKLLNYRSLESMLKRADLRAILIAAPYIESASWQQSFAKAVKSTPTTSYELRSVGFVRLSGSLYQGCPGPSNYVAVSKPGGSVAIWPSQRISHASALYLSLILLEGLEGLSLDAHISTIFHINPIFDFWRDASNLLALDNERAVSLHIKDVATNHLAGLNYSRQQSHHAGQALWIELINRYRQYQANFPSQLEGVGGGIKETVVPQPKQLLEDYAVVK